MSQFGEILGQHAPIDLLERMTATRRLPHALLFHGPEAVGKATIARHFCAVLLCVGDDGSSCGSCPSCLAFAAGGHPDLFQVKLQLKNKATAAARTAFAAGELPDPDDLSKEIVVDQIRELSHLASLSPRLGARRVFLIDPADAMNTTAQNALLKTLEEPPGKAILMLIASRPHLLLPTVRSRCFSLGFAALPSAKLAGLLEQRGIDSGEAALRAALSEGRPGRALELDLTELRDRREELLTILERLVSGPGALGELAGMSAALAGRHERTLVQGLDLLAGLLRDALRYETDECADALIHVDLSSRLSRLGRSLGAPRAAELVGGVERCRGDLRFNVNRAYVAETLLAAVAGGPLP
jgi:DNA polymerase-3 subunit delta'